jgi:hypothetical protein
MEVIESTPARLVAEHRPRAARVESALGTLAFAVLGIFARGYVPVVGFVFFTLAMVSAGLFAWSMRRQRVVFDRAAGQVVLTSRGVGGSQTTEQPLAAVTGAAVASASDPEYRGISGEPVLELESGARLPLVGAEISLAEAEALAAAINAWLSAR